MRQSIKEVEKLAKGTYAQSIIDSTAPETAASVIFTLGTYFSSLRLTRGKVEESFSIKSWVTNKDSDSLLFITSQADCSSELVPLQTAWWEIAFKSILTRDRNPHSKIWVILDEIASLNQIPSLQDTMSKSREYGGCFVLGLQNMAQVEEIYGKGARTISSLCNTRCIFKTKDPDTALWMSKNIGDKEIEEVREGVSYGAHQMRDGVSVNKNFRTTPLVMASEIQNLPKLHLFLQMPDYPFIKTKIEYKERSKLNKHFIENEQLIKELNELHQAKAVGRSAKGQEQIIKEQKLLNDEDSHQNSDVLIKEAPKTVGSEKTTKESIIKPANEKQKVLETTSDPFNV